MTNGPTDRAGGIVERMAAGLRPKSVLIAIAAGIGVLVHAFIASRYVPVWVNVIGSYVDPNYPAGIFTGGDLPSVVLAGVGAAMLVITLIALLILWLRQSWMILAVPFVVIAIQFGLAWALISRYDPPFAEVSGVGLWMAGGHILNGT